MKARLFVASSACALLIAASAAALAARPAPDPAPRTLSEPDALAIAADVAPPAALLSAVAPQPAAPAEVLPTPVAAPPRAVFEKMSHVWQTLNNCGPATVVMALSALGVSVDQETARLALRGPDVRRGMGPQGVGPWVKENWDLRSTWRNNGTVELIKSLVANGFVPMVTQWMQDPSVSRIAHWRTVRGYDDAAGVFYVNDPMLGNMVALDYGWFARNWQSFSYRYMVIYRSEQEPLLKAVIGRDWSDAYMRQALYERNRADALATNTVFAWLAYGEAAYANGVFDEAVAAFQRGLSMGSASGAFGVRNSYPQALRALGRTAEADAVAKQLQGISAVPSTVAPAPDWYAVYLALRRMTPYELLPAEN